ncbi:MAG TPA: MBL fold metallo-hydrolase [Ktedonobacteraceae bacterium]|nr:MBL fold metallo-hydrolase [Ktedonobacteraceae bacterium]
MKISEHCYTLSGLSFIPPWSVNAGFIVGEERTLIVDTGANTLSAQTIHGYASSVRPQNSLLVINTELHLDHVSGNGFFRQRDIPVYGHYKIQRTDAELAESIAELNELIPNPVRRAHNEALVFYTETSIANPDHPITEEIQLDLGGRTVQILLTPGHTPANISIYVPDEQVMYSGDCLISGYLPNLEAGTHEDWHIWLASLEKIRALAPTVVMPGHGQILRGQQIQSEIDRTRAVLHEAIHTGQAPTLRSL